MTNFMRKTGCLLEQVSEKAVKIMTLILCGALALGVSTTTFRFPIDYQKEYLQEYADSPLKNLAAAFAVLLLFYLSQKLIFYKADEGQKKKRVWILVWFTVILTGILLSIWVTVSRMEIYWDQLEVFRTAGSFRAGDYSSMEWLYLSLYTQQYGLIFLEELLMGIWPDYIFMQYINVIFICMILFLSYRITDSLFHNQTANLYCLALTELFLPMHLYVTYVYGDLCSIACSLLAVYCLLRWNENGKWHYLAIAAIGSVIAVLARVNTVIPLLSIAIVCIILSLKKWSIRPFIFGLVLLLLPIGSTQAVQKHYERRSGHEINGAPFLLWIAMGMMDNEGAIGLYNGYVESIWGACEMSKKEATKAAASDIRNRLEDFRQDPGYAWKFYRFKVLEQWTEPSFSSLTLTGKRAHKSEERLVKFVYYGIFPDLLLRFMNYYLFVLYFGAFCHAADSLRRREGILHSLLAIAVIGGFLFCIIWEAKGRYMLPFAIFLLPYTARGIQIAQHVAYSLVKRLFHKVSLYTRSTF